MSRLQGVGGEGDVLNSKKFRRATVYRSSVNRDDEEN